MRRTGQHNSTNLKTSMRYVPRRWALWGLLVGMASAFVYNLWAKNKAVKERKER